MINLITKNSLLNSATEIRDSFAQNKYVGNVHALNTLSEFYCSVYYAELKPPLPEDRHVQLATLWKLVECLDSPESYKNKHGNELQESLTEGFNYITDSWNPRELTDKDKSRALSLITDCQDAVLKDSAVNRTSRTQRAGYCINGRFQGRIFSDQVIRTIERAQMGFVIYDDWNDFMFIIESNGVYSLFLWWTGA